MKQRLEKYREIVWNKSFMVSMVGGLVLLCTSLIINYFAGSFASHSASNPVTDIILDNTTVKDVDGLFIYGSMVLWIFVSGLLIWKPKYAPFVLKSLALFIFIRSISISLTHIAPFPGQINLPTNSLIRFFTFGGDLFFSAHTGLPFLLTILFWNTKTLRYLFLATSLLFAFVVLAGHYHYSIDVFAAFFITPTIASLAKLFFEKDYQMFISESELELQKN